MSNNLVSQKPRDPRFGVFSPYMMVTCETRIRFRRSMKRLTYKCKTVEVLTAYYLNKLLNRPATSLEVRIEPRRHWYSPWHYVVRHEFRLMSLVEDKATTDIIATLSTKLGRHGFKYDSADRIIIYPKLKDQEI